MEFITLEPWNGFTITIRLGINSKKIHSHCAGAYISTEGQFRHIFGLQQFCFSTSFEIASRHAFRWRYLNPRLNLHFTIQAHEITSRQADALLLCQYNIFDVGINLESINIEETTVTKDIIRVGQLFNRTIYLIWVKVYCFFLQFLCFINDKIPIC